MYTSRNLKQSRPSSLARTNVDTRTGIVFLIISILIHGVVFGAMLFFQDFTFPKPMPPVIQVDLVSFAPDPVLNSPDEPPQPSSTDGVALKAKKVQSKPKKIKHIKPDISLKTKPKNIKELMKIKQQKKKTEEKPKKKIEKKAEAKPEKKPEEKVEPEKDAEKVKEELVKQVDDQNRERIAEALRRLQKTVKGQGETKEGASQKGPLRRGPNDLKPIDLYHQVIQFSIRQNWVYTDILAGMDQQLEVVILIKILGSGEIRDIFYETRSGNRYLDESAKRAIMKINPLPPLPSGKHSYDLGLIFTPKGLK